MYNSTAALKRHMRNHTRDNLYKCSECDKEFTRKDLLVSHMKVHTNITVKDIPCTSCDVTTESQDGSEKVIIPNQTEVLSENIKYENTNMMESDVSENLLRHEKEGELSDQELEECFDVARHKRRHECPECKKKFFRLQHLREHSMIHQRIRQMALLEGETLNIGQTKTMLKKHTCHICNRKYLHEKSLKFHMRDHIRENWIKCSDCDEEFPRKDALLRHTKKHAELKMNENFAQKLCNENLQSEETNTMESALSENEALEKIEEPVKYFSKPKNRYRCEYCGKQCMTAYILAEHRRSHTGEKPHECPECKKRFARRLNLRHHLILHENSGNLGSGIYFPESEYKHKCEYCNKRCKSIFVLTEHKRSHTGEKPYECPECKLKFAQRQNFKRHCKIHERNQRLGLPELNRRKIKKKIPGKSTAENIPKASAEPVMSNQPEMKCKNITSDTSSNEENKKILVAYSASRTENIRDDSQETVIPNQSEIICANIKREIPASTESAEMSVMFTENTTRNDQEDSKLNVISIQPYNKYVQDITCKIIKSELTDTEELAVNENKLHRKYEEAICSESLIKTTQDDLKEIVNQPEITCENIKCEKTDAVESANSKEDISEPWKKHKCEYCDKKFVQSTDLVRHKRRHTGERPYGCTECNKKFFRAQSLKEHARAHERKRKLALERMQILSNDTGEVSSMYTCHLCNRQYERKKSLSMHIKYSHKRKIFIKCSECPRQFLRKACLKKHILLIHFGPRAQGYFCKICNNKYKSNTALIRHLRSHSGQDMVKCSQCDSVIQKAYLKKHMALHSKVVIKKYSCKICNRNFKRNTGLNVHMRSHTGENFVQCTECNKVVTKNYFRSHMELHGKQSIEGYTCPICFNKYQNDYALKRHMQNHTRENCMKCTECDKLLRKEYLKKHMEIHAKTKLKDISIERSESKTGNILVDSKEIVMETTIDDSNLKKQNEETSASTVQTDNHAVKQNKITDKNAFNCSMCDKKFYNKKNFQKHTIMHAQEMTDAKVESTTNKDASKEIDNPNQSKNITSVTVDMVESAATDNKLWLDDESTKQNSSKLKTFQCNYCCTQFSTPYVLMEHTRTHTGERPFECLLCNKNFYRKHHLKEHYKTDGHIVKSKLQKMGSSIRDTTEIKFITTNFENTPKNEHDYFKTVTILNQPMENFVTEKSYKNLNSEKTYTISATVPHNELHQENKVISTAGSESIDSKNMQHLLIKNAVPETRCENIKYENTDTIESAASDIELQQKNEENSASSKTTSIKIEPHTICENINNAENTDKIESTVNDKTLLQENKALEKITTQNSNTVKKESETHSCQICDKEYVFPSSLKSHMRTHIQNNLFKCLECNQEFVRKFSLIRHMKVHFGATIKADKKQLTERQIEILVEMVGADYDRLTERHTTTQAQIDKDMAWDKIAEECNKYGPPIKTMLQWRKSWTDIKCRTKDIISKQPKEANLTVANPSKIKLTPLQQKINEMRNPKAMVYACQICKKKFRNNVTLKRHVRSHTRDNIVQCSKCPIKLRKENLKRHVELHTRTELRKAKFIKDQSTNETTVFKIIMIDETEALQTTPTNEFKSDKNEIKIEETTAGMTYGTCLGETICKEEISMSD